MTLNRLFATFVALGILAASQSAAEPRALLVGIDRYQEPSFSFDIPGASKSDVADMHRALIDVFGYPEANIKTLLDDQATHGAIIAAIDDWLGAEATRGDDVVFFYVGHGYFTSDTSGDESDGLDEAIVPYDARRGGDARRFVAENLVIDDELGQAFARLTGRNVTAIFDSCNSGTVTRALTPGPRVVKTARTIQFAGLTRSLRGEESVQAQKREGGFFDSTPGDGRLTVWSAASAVQLALIDTERPSPFGGVFTGAFTEGVRGAADANNNGVVSHAELFAYVSAKSEAYCGRHEDECELGLTPRLDQSAGSLGDPVGPIPARPEDRPEPPLPDLIEDYLAKGNTHGITLAQIPPSPVRVGTKDIRFRITSPQEGKLILLSVTDDGELVHLYPNEYAERGGVVRADSPITVPDDFYGMRINADSLSSGTVFAIVASGATVLPEAVTSRLLSIVPDDRFEDEYLEPLAESLGAPVNESSIEENTQSGDWSVAKLRYEIVE